MLKTESQIIAEMQAREIAIKEKELGRKLTQEEWQEALDDCEKDYEDACAEADAQE